MEAPSSGSSRCSLRMFAEPNFRLSISMFSNPPPFGPIPWPCSSPVRRPTESPRLYTFASRWTVSYLRRLLSENAPVRSLLVTCGVNKPKLASPRIAVLFTDQTSSLSNTLCIYAMSHERSTTGPVLTGLYRITNVASQHHVSLSSDVENTFITATKFISPSGEDLWFIESFVQDSSKVHIIQNHRYPDQCANVDRSAIGSPLIEGKHNEQPFIIGEATSGNIRPVEKINSNLSWHCPDKVDGSVIELRAASTTDERNLWTLTRMVS
ncbi:hypothetical protein OF83DRAFT_344313 [Amylostereum chailletii]|nr:hypothetical protein OF83DRAFT_344313 [Amylostereum chailletii]